MSRYLPVGKYRDIGLKNEYNYFVTLIFLYLFVVEIPTPWFTNLGTQSMWLFL